MKEKAVFRTHQVETHFSTSFSTFPYKTKSNCSHKHLFPLYYLSHFNSYQTLGPDDVELFKSINQMFFVDFHPTFIVFINLTTVFLTDRSSLLKWNSTRLLFDLYLTLNSTDTVDVLAYNDGNGTRLVLANTYITDDKDTGSVDIFAWTGSYLKLESNLEVRDISIMYSFKVWNERYIATAVNYDDKRSAESQLFSIYKVTPDGLVIFQRTYLLGVKDIIGFERNGTVFMIVAYVKDCLSKYRRGGKLSVYKFAKTLRKFVEVYTFPTPGPINIETIEINGQIYLSCVSQSGYLSLFLYLDGFGFTEVLKVNSNGLAKASFFTIGQQVYVSLAAYIQSQSIYYPMKRQAYSRILKANLSGTYNYKYK